MGVVRALDKVLDHQEGLGCPGRPRGEDVGGAGSPFPSSGRSTGLGARKSLSSYPGPAFPNQVLGREAEELVATVQPTHCCGPRAPGQGRGWAGRGRRKVARTAVPFMLLLSLLLVA